MSALLTLNHLAALDGKPASHTGAAVRAWSWSVATPAVRGRVLALLLVTLACGSLHPAIGQCVQQWVPSQGLRGIDGTVRAMIEWDPDGAGPSAPLLIVGGQFSAAGNVAAKNIAAWNGSEWSALGLGTDGPVRALAVTGGGDLLIGGEFFMAGGAPASRLARWDGSAWSSVAGGVNGWVYALARLSDGSMAVGGAFTSIGGVNIEYTARWDGVNWSPLAGPDGFVLALVTLPGGRLVAGGSFRRAGGQIADNIAEWTGSGWQPLGSGLTNTTNNEAVNTLTVMPNGDLIAGGDFDRAGGVYASKMARWNGTAWSAVSSNVFTFSTIYTLLALGNGDLLAGGSSLGVRRWNGTSWTTLGPTQGTVHALVTRADGTLAGGSFNSLGGVSANSIASWNGAAWSSLSPGMDRPVLAMAVTPSGEVLAGGRFLTAGDVEANRIARWNGRSWAAVGEGVNNDVNCIAVWPNGEVAIGGAFTQTGAAQPVSRVAKWAGDAWIGLGTGIGGTVRALAVLSNGDLVACGPFTSASGITANGVASWDGVAWSSLGSGLTGTKNCLLALSDGEFLAGGAFTIGPSGAPVARWNGTGWALLPGLSGTVNAMARTPDGRVIAAGDLIIAGIGLVFVASWDGSTWTPLGAAQPRSVSALALLADGDLVAGGEFAFMGSPNTALWNGTSWEPMHTGTNGPVRALAALSDGNLMVGGEFTVAGPHGSGYWARWSHTGRPWVSGPPQSQRVCGGDGVVFNVAVAGDAPSYQWRRDGQDLPGATAASLALAAVSVADMGNYDCVLSNTCGQEITPTASLTVDVAPSVTIQPASATRCRGESVTFTAVAQGTPPLSYQWRFQGVDLVGETSPTLIIDPVTPRRGGAYVCSATNGCGSVTSSIAALAVCTADFNCSGSVSVQDVFDFLVAYFAGEFEADIDESMSIGVQDIFDYLASYFAGCP